MFYYRLDGLGHLTNENGNNMDVVPALFHYGRWYIIPNKINGRKKSLLPRGLVSSIQAQAGREYIQSETDTPFMIPDNFTGKVQLKSRTPPSKFKSKAPHQSTIALILS
jgi:hypothetical protein